MSMRASDAKGPFYLKVVYNCYELAALDSQTSALREKSTRPIIEIAWSPGHSRLDVARNNF